MKAELESLTAAQKTERRLAKRSLLPWAGMRLKANVKLCSAVLRRFDPANLKKVEGGPPGLPPGTTTPLDLSGMFLARADLSGAPLQRASLVNAHLHGANLDNASLEGASLEGAMLLQAQMRSAHCSPVNRPPGVRTRLGGAVININTDLAGTNWWAATFRNPDSGKDDASLIAALYDRYGAEVPSDMEQLDRAVRDFLEQKRSLSGISPRT